MIYLGLYEIGNRLLTARKKTGLTQNEIAEKAGLSNRTYADIERGTVNMRLETLIQICMALNITPNEILLKEENDDVEEYENVISDLNTISHKEKKVALKLLSTYLDSIK